MSARNWSVFCVVLALGLAACSSGEVMSDPDAPPAGPGASGATAAHSGTGGTGGAAAAPRGGSAATPAPGKTPIDPKNVPPVACDQVKTGPRRLWRLTQVQYDNTIRDLFGMESTFGQGFPADEVLNGFDNNADTLQVTPLLADKLQAAAQDISARADLARLAPCASAAKDDACFRDIASRFGERAFRRPLKPAEVDRYAALAKTAGGFEPGARLIVLAMLQSPNFLYRFEIGTHDAGSRFALDDYEIASELSYMVWQTMPDDMLLAAARSGKLHEPAQVKAQLDRLLASERAKPMVRAFVFDWLGLDAVTTVPKDTGRFPELTADVRAALRAEAERFVDHVMFASGDSLSALLTSPSTYLDAALTKFYGAGTPDPSQPSDLSAQERRGILTLGATMLTHARSNDSSPVHRGKLVRERLLCQELPPPPPGIVVQPPPLDPNKTTRERYAAHSSVDPCLSCHRLMDPIGLTFEHFDGIGRFRANDNGKPIDVRGEILGSFNSDGKFNGVSELIDQLETSEDVQGCYSLSWLRFAYGMPETAESLCVIRRVQDEVAGGDGSLAAILAALTQSEQFYARTGDPNYEPPAPEPDPAPEPGSSPGPGMMEPPPTGLDTQITQNNDWGAGYCKAYTLKNLGTTPVTWSIPLMVDGKINNHWECDISADTGNVTFTGAAHNATLQPNAQGSFGFCATR